MKESSDRFRLTLAFPALPAGLLILLLLVTSPGRAQEPAAPQTAESRAAPDDQGPVRVRRPAPGRLDTYRNDRDYHYGQDVQPTDSLWDKFWNWFFRKIARFFASESYENFWQYVILAVLAGGAVWLLIKAQILGFVFKASRSRPLGYETLTENIHEMDFGAAIDEAVQQANYRLAVRLLYLRTLKNLTDRRLIDWQPNKTNRSYVYELGASPLQADFEQLTTRFEYVWYGDFPVSGEQFAELRETFRRFNHAFQASPADR
ncbi:DUF4129 domain-containing protein [Larkinella soli]|uniref:DUF4129 domain-containing protein n=1 Tax=Larkinella soli TaxID=1770527 RepID=UPI000FFBD65C|nr:DUF4129 domain-containing protein [Larkinella soli]